MTTRKQMGDALRNLSMTKKKARKVLHDGKVHGKALTPKQRRLFGAKASGKY